MLAVLSLSLHQTKYLIVSIGFIDIIFLIVYALTRYYPVHFTKQTHTQWFLGRWDDTKHTPKKSSYFLHAQLEVDNQCHCVSKVLAFWGPGLTSLTLDTQEVRCPKIDSILLLGESN